MTIRTCLLFTCAAGALTCSGQAAAQTTAPPTRADQAEAQPTDDTQDDQAQRNPDGSRRTVVEERDRAEIVVTGQRLSDVLTQARSAAVITAEQRNLAGVGDVRQLIEVQPGFNYSAAFGISVRGVGRQTEQTLLGQENTVVAYVDGFIQLVPSNIAESTLFGGNIQFIRGPSGTTYGRNSLAGSVNLISRAPTPEFTAQAVAGIGRAGYYDLGVNASGPITSNLGFRIGAEKFGAPTIQQNLGSARGAGFAQDNLYIEFQLEWRYRGFHIRSRTTTFEYNNQPGYPSRDAYSVGTPFVPPATAATGVFGGLAPNPQFQYAGPVPSGPYQINVDFAGYDRLRDNFQTIINADLDLGFATLYYVGGYQQYKATGSADVDQTSRASYNPFAPGVQGAPIAPVFAPGTIVPTDYRNNYLNDNNFWSQEARLESKPNDVFTWVLGYYHFEQSFDQSFSENIPGATAVLATPQVSVANPAPGAPNPRLSTFEQRDIFDIRSDAVFGNMVWDLSEHLRLDAGLRYTWDGKDALTNFRYIFYYPPLFAADVSPAVHGAQTSRDDQGLSGRAALAYRFGENSQVYILYQRGYQASAFTLGQSLPPNNIADKEHLDVYELGGHFGLGNFRIDGSVFYQNFFNQQIPISTRNTITTPTGTAPGPIFTTFANARLSRIDGAELQVTWRPTISANIVASYTYLNPTFRDFSGPIDLTEPATIGGVANPLAGAPQDLSGNEIPRTPRHKATLYGYYGIDLGSAGFLYPGGNLSYQSSFYTSPFEVGRFRIPERTVAGLTLTYRTRDERLDVTGSVSNLFRNRYLDNFTVLSFDGGAASTVRSYGADRYWTVTARYRF